MGTVLTVMNMKGGVGKTTVAMHIGGMASRYSLGGKSQRKVLLIDYDPQFNLSQALLPAKTYFQLEKERKTTIAVLLDNEDDLNPYQLQVPGNHKPPKVQSIATNIYAMKGGGRLDLVPSTLDLMYVALGQGNSQWQPIEERFQKFISEARDLYELVIIDCHPAGSLFTRTSLRNSDHVLIPVAPQRYSVRGISLMLRFVDAHKSGEKGAVPHILFNMAPRSGISDQEATIRASPTYAKYCLDNTLKHYSAYSEPEDGRGFVWFSTKPWSTTAFRNLESVAKELVHRLGA